MPVPMLMRLGSSEAVRTTILPNPPEDWCTCPGRKLQVAKRLLSKILRLCISVASISYGSFSRQVPVTAMTSETDKAVFHSQLLER